jgi:hypothetical protein
MCRFLRPVPAARDPLQINESVPPLTHTISAAFSRRLSPTTRKEWACFRATKIPPTNDPLLTGLRLPHDHVMMIMILAVLGSAVRFAHLDVHIATCAIIHPLALRP